MALLKDLLVKQLSKEAYEKSGDEESPLTDFSDLRLTKDEQLELSYYPIDILEFAVTSWRKLDESGKCYGRASLI